MKIRSLISAMALLCAVSMCGCGSEESSSSSAVTAASTSSASEASTSAETFGKAAEAETKAGYNYYDTEDGMFRVGLSGDYKEYKENGLSSCEFTLTPDELSLVGFMSVSGRHFTAMGFTSGLVEDFKKEFDNVKCEETEANGLPAAVISAEKTQSGVLFNFEYYLVQFGNGDLLMIAKGTPVTSSYNIDIEEILKNVEYKGEPLRETDSEINGKYFHMTLGSKFYADGADEKFKIRYNLADSEERYTTGLNISTEFGKPAASMADKQYEKWSANSKIKELKRDKADFMGRDCEHMSYYMDVVGNKVNIDWYAFYDGGAGYNFTMLYPDSTKEQFLKDIQPALDSFETKDNN